MAFIIAEIGMNHNGSFKIAKDMIKAAAKCGADAVKFQTHIAEAETLRNAPSPPYFKSESRYNYFKRTAFSLDEYKKLKAYTRSLGLKFISSVFSIEAVDFLEKLGVSIYKVPSGEVNNVPLLERLSKTGKKIILSSGMSTWKELDCAVKVLRSNKKNKVIILQCTSEYPCMPKDAGLNAMVAMKNKYKIEAGFSDHTSGIGVSIAAVTLGALVIEKHFTLSKYLYGPDAKNSATPQEFSILVKGIREAEAALKSKVNKDKKAAGLKHMKKIFEKSIVAACDIPEGTIIKECHLAYKKPGDGMPAKRYKELIGKKARKAIKYNQQIKFSMFCI